MPVGYALYNLEEPVFVVCYLIIILSDSRFFSKKMKKLFRSFCMMIFRGGSRGGAAGAAGFDPLTNQRFPLWHYFMTSIFGQPTLSFLEAPSTPAYTNLERGAHAEKTRFWEKYYHKKPQKRHFWPVFCFKTGCGARNLVKKGSLE